MGKKEVDLFGDEIDDNAHAATIKLWAKLWSGKYGTEYPFTRRDAKHIKDLLDRTKATGKVDLIMKAYLAEGDKFYAGHKLGKLLADLPRWIGALNGPTTGRLAEPGKKVRRL